MGGVRLVAAWLVVSPATLATPQPHVASDVADAIRVTIRDQPELSALYSPGGFAPLWTDSSGGPTDSARDALRLLEHATIEGLDPTDYEVAQLRSLITLVETGRGVEPDRARARFDIALSDAVLTYLHHLRDGRVDPRTLGIRLTRFRDEPDLSQRLREAVLTRTVIGLSLASRPRGPVYPALVSALDRYRVLSARESAPALPFQKSVHPGESYEDLSALHARLVLLGDLGAHTPVPRGDRYDDELVDAVKRFQRRHALDADGVLGKQTIAQLSVSLARRVRQLELALERQRWLPRESNERLILVNIPMFRLFAWETIPPAGAPSFSTGVIVGQARRTETPVFDAVMTDILFRPYWNVPRSIVVNEILPMLRKRPDYLVRENLELVAGDRDDSPVVAATPENLARLAGGELRLRQRRGPKNALGLIKFNFPNPNDVYMHATPATSLFSRGRRDFSHGCVRVQDPIGLAEWVLAGQGGWDRARIIASMEAAESSRVAVERPLRVILFYSTALVMLDSGDVAFADDIYGQDERLERALRERVRRSPGANAAGIDVDEVGRRIETDAAALH